jgi:hypothetical protein
MKSTFGAESGADERLGWLYLVYLGYDLTQKFLKIEKRRETLSLAARFHLRF